MLFLWEGFVSVQYDYEIDHVIEKSRRKAPYIENGRARTYNGNSDKDEER